MINFLLNKNLVPDFLIRQKIRKLNEERLSIESSKYSSDYVDKFIQDLKLCQTEKKWRLSGLFLENW